MGVKQLWTLLGPVGRPVLLETMEGKTMAIDSSIWIYQFQATMRDKDGRALVNAHVLGFLRRICKLLFYGINPVFVFDGGAPVLKRTTLIERKRKKAGAADSHAKVAEKLLAAHMRREAIAHVQEKKAQANTMSEAPRSGPILDENTVYLEDLEFNVPKRTPTKEKGKEPEKKSPDSSTKKAKFHDHDPYRLPDVDPVSMTQPTSSFAPDPRLATEDELRTFIESMRPEDFDVNSPAFRDLPTEVQYEIIGDLRLKSRQTSHKRLQSMLRTTSTPLDFSKAQIRNLQQRNSLTQQLLETTDSIGKANVTIPVRIASERNKEYVLVKNQGQDGGWVLGIRDEGTQIKPIVIDNAGQKHDSDEDGDSEMEMEEVAIPGTVAPDPDLREYHGRMALASITKRNAAKKPLPRPPQASGSKPAKPKSKPPLFIAEMDEEDDLDVAIQQSLEQQEADALQQAISASMTEIPQAEEASAPEVNPLARSEDSDDEDLYVGPSRLDTALAFANTSPSKRTLLSTVNAPMFGSPSLLLSEKATNSVVSSAQMTEKSSEDTEDDDTVEEVIPELSSGAVLTTPGPTLPIHSVSDEMEPTETPRKGSSTTALPEIIRQTSEDMPLVVDDNLEDLYEDIPVPGPSYVESNKPLLTLYSGVIREGEPRREPSPPSHAISEVTVPSLPVTNSSPQRVTVEEVPDEDEPFSDWERSSSPIVGHSTDGPAAPRTSRPEVEDWDAAQEMDVAAEEGGFAEFMSQVKGQDLDAARRDIDNEIQELNKQKKVAMRDSEDITQHMISQIMLMLRLFGIPYITAPMEAEAQCATLVSLGLVDGVITDDSDVFLFGGLRVYKNMFNQSKTIESFLLSDLGRELGLDRDKLIRLAYLLGSDYVDGLPGVGPVVAMELMKEFPGDDGLHKFREWWKKVQSGKDTNSDTNSKFRRRFKKRFKNLYLPDDWPNPAVRDAYYHPAVDESEEPFKWGLPDLDALHDFFRQELGWHQGKVDDLLLPIIHKMGQRGQAAAANRQGTLDGYLNVSLGNGTFAPRKRQAYSSKRLQQVVADFRAEQSKTKSVSSPEQTDDGGSATEGPPKKKRKGKEKATEKAPVKRKPRASQRGAGRKRKTTTRSSPESERDEVVMEENVESIPPPALAAKLRPRPKPAYQDIGDDENGEEEAEGSDEEFTIKRSRKKL